MLIQYVTQWGAVRPAKAQITASEMQHCMGLLPDTKTCELHMHRERRERFPRHRLQRKPIISDPGIANPRGGEIVSGIPGACTPRNFTYLARGPCPAVDFHTTMWPHISCHRLMVSIVMVTTSFEGHMRPAIAIIYDSNCFFSMQISEYNIYLNMILTAIFRYCSLDWKAPYGKRLLDEHFISAAITLSHIQCHYVFINVKTT